MNGIALHNVSYRYRRQPGMAVHGVELAFEQGTLYAIVGKSGSGKSTLLALMAGLDRPAEGMVTYNGQNTVEIDADTYHRNHVSMIFQNHNLLSHLSVLENVMVPLLLQKRTREAAQATAAEKIRLVGLDDTYFPRLPSTLSGGEAQRAAVARAGRRGRGNIGG